MTDNPVTRVYHPRANAWKDVPTSRVEDWAAQGWVLERHDRIDPEEALVSVGTGYAPATVPEIVVDTSENPVSGPPAGNAARDEWVRYAIENGATPEDVEGKTRNEIRREYAPADN